MRTLLLELTGFWFLILLRIMQGNTQISDDDEYRGTVFWQFFNFMTEEFVLPVAHFCIATIYSIYLKLTLVNMIIFFVKYVPTGLYAYRFMKDIYLPSRERIRQKRNEIDDIQLQIQIVNTKLSVRDADRAEQQRRSVERLRRVRARVRDLIDSDDALKQTFYTDTNFDPPDIHVETCSEETEQDTIMKLLKELKYDPSIDMSDMPDINLYPDDQTAPEQKENGFYPLPGDVDPAPECHVKIVKVTNVYKVAYLKQYIKLKRLRRASKQALLKKKMEGVKKLLEDWQNKLNMVINSTTFLNCNGHSGDIDSHEAMGDYSTARGSDSDSDMQNSYLDSPYDDYGLSWDQNPYSIYEEDSLDPSVTKEYEGLQEYSEFKYTAHGKGNMVAIVEETNSQIECEENRTEDGECSDLISL